MHTNNEHPPNPTCGYMRLSLTLHKKQSLPPYLKVKFALSYRLQPLLLFWQKVCHHGVLSHLHKMKNSVLIRHLLFQLSEHQILHIVLQNWDTWGTLIGQGSTRHFTFVTKFSFALALNRFRFLSNWFVIPKHTFASLCSDPDIGTILWSQQIFIMPVAALHFTLLRPL